MAQLDCRTFKRIEKQCREHEPVQATYTTFERYGRSFLQIDMYGRSYRENPDKISQTIQIDKESARILFDLLKKTFNF